MKIKEDMDLLKAEIKSLKNKPEEKSKLTFGGLDLLKDEFEKLKNKVKDIRGGPENSYLDMEMIDSRFNNFQEMVLGKLDLEISSLKFELNSNLEKLNDDILSIKKELTTKGAPSADIDQKVQNTFTNFSEIIDEKMNLEVNSLKIEFTEEIAKLYDRFFSEIVDFKNELNKIQNKPLIAQKQTKEVETKKSKKVENKVESKIEKKNEDLEEKPKKEGKLKKVAKWLFVDEEEDFEDLKNQIKKGE